MRYLFILLNLVSASVIIIVSLLFSAVYCAVLVHWLVGELFLLLTLVLLNKSDDMPTSNFQPIKLLDPDC